VYLTGLSMGGYGTWSLGLKYPERFAAIAPVCGGGSGADILLAKRRPGAGRYAPSRSGRFTAQKTTSYRLPSPKVMVAALEKGRLS
jgi:pimeloyl-ACP methyl ester carboxylesterase